MGSSFILKVRICQKPLKPFFHQGSSAFFTQKTSLCKSSQLPFSARFLCTRDSSSNPGGRHTDRSNSGQGGVKNNTIRHQAEESWEDAANGRGKRATLRQIPSFPKSVFTAGTAKRTAERLRRKAALVSQDEQQQVEEIKGRSTRGAGRTCWNFLLNESTALFGSHCFSVRH